MTAETNYELYCCSWSRNVFSALQFSSTKSHIITNSLLTVLQNLSVSNVYIITIIIIITLLVISIDSVL